MAGLYQEEVSFCFRQPNQSLENLSERLTKRFTKSALPIQPVQIRIKPVEFGDDTEDDNLFTNGKK